MGLIVISLLDNQSKKQCLGYNCECAMKGELFPGGGGTVHQVGI